jgi:mono/diheme cytochrome c family protein
MNPVHTHSVARQLLAAALALAAALPAHAVTAADQLAGYQAKAGAPTHAARGQQFFNATHGREWSCASCHGATPVGTGKHANTGKPIQPLAPAANDQRFTDVAKTEKWFRRNCNDVLGRECSAGEKADLLAWLLTLQR